MSKFLVNKNPSNEVGEVPQNQSEINKANNKLVAKLVLPQLEDFNLSIVRPRILAKNFELKPIKENGI